MSSLLYGSVFCIVGVTVYSAIIYVGYRKSAKEHLRVNLYFLNLKEVIEDIKRVITKEENGMLDKNARSSEHQAVEPMMFFGHKREIVNELTLTDLLTIKPTDADYDEIVGLLTTLCQSTYAQYKFLIIKSTDETEETHFLQIVSPAAENPELHKEIFAKALNTGVDYVELVKRFAAHVAAGNVVDLGEDVVVITNDGTKMIPTGVSQINSGLEGGEITFNISFIKKENLDAFNEKHVPHSGPANA